MFKIIIKNLWARRRRNGWLFAELILVSIVTWVILDPVIVLTHDRHIPSGYQEDHLYVLSLGALEQGALGYDKMGADSASMVDNYLHLVRRVKDYPDVIQATPVLGHCYLNSQGNSFSEYRAEGDTVDIECMIMRFVPHTHFFETFGIKGGKRMSAEKLSDYNYTNNDIVITENLAVNLFGKADVYAKRCYSANKKDTTYMPVIGTLKDLKAYSSWRPSPIAFQPQLTFNAQYIPHDAFIAIRLKENVGTSRFLHEFRPWMTRNLKAGNLFVRSVKPYTKLIEDREFTEGVTSTYRMNMALALFFLMNLCLGVIGTFWLQTRVRREEVGIMLSFGATPGYIIRLLIGEGLLLTTLSTLIGCVLYLQYVIKEGLYEGNGWVSNQNGYWVSDFVPHFVIVSFIVYFILLLVVIIGIYIPARKISKIPPTEALHDE